MRYTIHILHIDVGKYEEAPMDMKKERMIMLKAVTDENRLHIIELLKQGERCACVLLESLHFSQPTLSHHMKVLCEAGLVKGRKEGKWVYYSLDVSKDHELSAMIDDLFQVTEKGDDSCDCCR